MVQGTSSSVGKSLLVAALCRIFVHRGVRVVPFKAQNMSNNAAVCADGAEIGRAQAVQAVAAGVEPCADINPILLKPEADSRSQVVVMGRAWRTVPAGEYYLHRDALWPIVTGALDRLRAAYELVIVEGAGSPAELNLRASDLVNMAVARHARAPVLLIGDVDRGGIFAQLLGTLWLLPAEERGLVRGLVVNKFRGDAALFVDGVRILEERSGVPVIGVIPFLPDLAIPEEDAVALEQPPSLAGDRSGGLDIAVIRFPRIANFDDFDPLAAEPGVRLRYVSSPADLSEPDAVILPGTKSTVADLDWMRRRGLAAAVRRLAASGVAVVGICGGYQMMGRTLRDPARVESDRDGVRGLGLLPADSVFTREKATHRVRARVLGGPGWLEMAAGVEVHGYEIHMGRTAGAQPWLEITDRGGQPASALDGAAAHGGRVWGCYLHGLFANDRFRRAWLEGLGERPGDREPASSGGSDLEGALDRLAEAVANALNIEQLEQIVWAS
jgi:adenosylcobyric acid synthase